MSNESRVLLVSAAPCGETLVTMLTPEGELVTTNGDSSISSGVAEYMREGEWHMPLVTGKDVTVLRAALKTKELHAAVGIDPRGTLRHRPRHLAEHQDAELVSRCLRLIAISRARTLVIGRWQRELSTGARILREVGECRHVAEALCMLPAMDWSTSHKVTVPVYSGLYGWRPLMYDTLKDFTDRINAL